MGLFKNTDKGTITLLQKENKRLEKERNELLAKLHEIEQYKEVYENLINETKIIKARYEDLISNAESVYSDYKNKLEEIISSEN
ncbi:MAG: hypothetical protein HFG38_09930 [Eubacterium sp.]|nr:hypothetical protein [Eubacterium sp.]